MNLPISSAKFCATAAKLRPSPPNSSVPRLRLIILVLLAALLLTACRDSDSASSETAESPAAADTATTEPPPEPTATSEPEPELTATSEPEPEPTATPVPEPEPAPTVTPPPQEEAATEMEEKPAGSQTFVIVAQESEARFIINEILLGQPKTVIGTTNALSGELTVDAANPAASVIGPFQIDAGTFVTDNDNRNGAIRRFILQSNQHQYITFNATELTGLQDAVSVGDEIEFEITGDLTVRDITNSVLFIVTMQVVSESELRGTAATIVAREAFEITIPQVPSVANVGEEFIVEFDFVARAE